MLRNQCSVSCLRRLAINLCYTHHICGVSWCRGGRVEGVPGFECTLVLTLSVRAETIHGVRSGICMSIHVRIPPPEPFDFNIPNSWCSWVKRFERYRQASTLHEEEGKKQVNLPMYLLGRKEEDVLSSLNLQLKVQLSLASMFLILCSLSVLVSIVYVSFQRGGCRRMHCARFTISAAFLA